MTIFFLKPSVYQIQNLKLLLQVFQRISGLGVNMDKSEIILTCSSQEHLLQCANLMGCKAGKFSITYLGLPLSDKRLTKDAYLSLIQQFNKRLPGWAAKQLSPSGRLVLMKAVLTSIPIYFMLVLQLSVWVLEQIEKIRRDFLWHGAD
jgi:hypothetical protein